MVACVCPCTPALAAWGAHGMVAAEHRLAAHAGVAILQRGGNAVDAAVATAFAVCVVNPSSCGIGGGGFMLIYLAKQQRAVALDYRETAPARASRDMFVRDGQVVPELSRRGGLAVAVPGEVAGLAAALRRYGTRPLATVLAPAIGYARDGFVVEDHLATEIAHNADALRATPGLGRVFLHADGSPVRAGETLRQPELARTLQRIADEGPAVFYRGDIAASIARSVDAAGGILSTADLAAYQPRWRAPLSGRHRADTVISMPPPSSGGGVLLEILGILQFDDLPALGRESPTYLHLLAEAMQHAFADRAEYYGDPDFVPVPLEQLLAPANSAVLRARISATHTLDHAAYGSHVTGQPAAVTDHGTSHVSVMDAGGNAVACTTTINTAFGAMVVAGDTGILLNNEMDDFSAQPGAPNVYGLVGSEANAVAPNKRPLSSMTPTIVTRDGQPLLVLGGSGGPWIISGTVEVLLNVLDFRMDAAAAVAAARIHDQWVPAALAVEPGIPQPVRRALARYGHVVKEVPSMAAIQAVRRQAGVFEGAADPRKGGEADGW
jgi:gamma-glutamyltranspeptidase/glutathione hydrolase